MTTSQNPKSPEDLSTKSGASVDSLPANPKTWAPHSSMVRCSPRARRERLLETMKIQEGLGFDCRACPGECCTSKSNSIKIDDIEAYEIYSHLVASGLWTEGLIRKLRDCICDYRLDVEIPSFGSRPNLRRTYTCPFYAKASNGPFGCSLPRDVRPLGCLAFNPTREHSRGLVDQCASDVATLAQQAELNENGQATHKIQEKRPIPIALIWCQVLFPAAPPKNFGPICSPPEGSKKT